MDGFERLDFEILDFMNSNSPADIETIRNHFSGIASIEYRVNAMSKVKYNPTGGLPLKNSSFLVQKYESVDTELGSRTKATGVFSITDYGKKALQDYKEKAKESRKELWLKNAWIPILVSIVTNLVISGIKQLWPLIQGLLARIP